MSFTVGRMLILIREVALESDRVAFKPISSELDGLGIKIVGPLACWRGFKL